MDTDKLTDKLFWLLKLQCYQTRKGLLLLVTHRYTDDSAVPWSMHSMQHDALIVTVHICPASCSRNHLGLWGWLSQGLQQLLGVAVLQLL